MGIRTKFLLWYLGLLVIFYGTILILFLQIHDITKVSDDIVNTRYKVSSTLKQMVDNLLTMEENEKKYRLLKKREYLDFFIGAQKGFEANLSDVLRLEPDLVHKSLWQEIHGYHRALLKGGSVISEDGFLPAVSWIPEMITNEWIRKISEVRLEDQREVERELLGLYERGITAFRWGMLGLGASVLVGLLGIVLITYSINRPLLELRKGIKSILGGGLGQPIRIGTRDELGEVARAFNEMASRLAQEERMRSDFISMLSHEIRTPLTSIRESVNLIEEEITGPINDRQRRLLRIASEEMERLTGLLHHLMQVSRLEAGVLDLDPQPTDPYVLVESCIQRLAPMAEGSRITVRTQVNRDLPPVMGNGAQLQQVLLNLIGNAIKFSPADGEVEVRVERDDQGGVRFAVSDRGPGIPEQEQPLVFQKYYRVSGTRDQVDGLGLGLSISKHIIEAHGGAIWLESRVGEGSTFAFTLPEAS